MDWRTEHDFWTRYVRGAPEDLQSRFLDESTDARSLIVRVLVAARRLAGGRVSADEIVRFLEASFGAYQAGRHDEAWRWSRPALIEALGDLERHGLVEVDATGHYELTALGRLTGESATEVASIVRLVDCLGPLRPEEITDPTLIAAVQTTAELDQVHFPMNKKSTQKEPQAWSSELSRQGGVPYSVLQQMGRLVSDAHQATLRAKRPR
jgi:helicase